MIFVHNSWDLFNWLGILWYGRFLYKGSFGMVSFVMGAFGMVSFVLTPYFHMLSEFFSDFLQILFCRKLQNCIRFIEISIFNCVKSFKFIASIF